MDHPDSPICLAAMQFAREHSPPFLFNHVMRAFAFGRAAGLQQGARFDPEMLFLGSVLHDLGLIEPFIGAERFEIDGANAAAESGIPQRKQPEIALVRSRPCWTRWGQ